MAVVKILSGQEIDPATDPYDGKLKRSECFMLL
jgi:hypothetical protein